MDALINAIGQGANVIEFSSPGGLVDEAIRGHTVLRDADVKTIANGPCASFVADHAQGEFELAALTRIAIVGKSHFFLFVL